MFARVQCVFLIIFALVASGAAMAQTNCLGISSTVPCIDKIDPPNWWANLPFLMLLVHGNHLADTHVAVAGSNISVTLNGQGFVALQLAPEQPAVYLVH